jgi:transcriptional regulator with PAS, ATPase and Fis domain
MIALYRQMELASRGDQPVLIVGETGVGKEGLVSIVHGSSQRREGPLVTLNCAAIPAELFEAELFGIGRGVATGVEARPGKVRQAEGGTLFLDEIGDMPLPLQTKLLRVLQEREIQPLGGKAETVDIRVVAATNAELEARMEEGNFRRDLYYRLAGAVLEVPPLRRRRADIPALVEHFLRRFAREAGIRVRGVTVKAMGCWLAHDWPGNVRELEHEVRRAVSATADLGIIDTHRVSKRPPSEPSGAGDDGAGPKEAGEPESLHLESRLAALEAELIREALHRTRGRQNHAAELLGVSRNGLARRLERLGIDYRDFR